MPSVEAIIDGKLEELAQIPPGPHGGRRLELGGASKSEYEQILRRSMEDIARRVSPDLLQMLPAVALEQLVVMSVVKDHDTAGLLKSLLNSFLVAYITPETHQRAFRHLEGLEQLRSEVAQQRQPAKH